MQGFNVEAELCLYTQHKCNIWSIFFCTQVQTSVIKITYWDRKSAKESDLILQVNKKHITEPMIKKVKRQNCLFTILNESKTLKVHAHDHFNQQHHENKSNLL